MDNAININQLVPATLDQLRKCAIAVLLAVKAGVDHHVFLLKERNAEFSPVINAKVVARLDHCIRCLLEFRVKRKSDYIIACTWGREARGSPSDERRETDQK